MTTEEFNGFAFGMWVASLICEEKAGKQTSHYASEIMRHLQTAKLRREIQVQQMESDINRNNWITDIRDLVPQFQKEAS